MFEKAIIRRAGDREIDLGMVADTIFFYGKTQLLINRNVVHELTQITCGDLLELSSRDCLSLSYVKPMFGVLSSGAIRVHDFGAYEFGPGEKKRTATFEEEILEAFIRAYGKSRSTNSAAKRFTDRVKLFRHPGFNNKSNVVCDLAREYIADFRFVRASVAESIHKIAPTYPLPADFTFEVFNMQVRVPLLGLISILRRSQKWRCLPSMKVLQWRICWGSYRRPALIPSSRHTTWPISLQRTYQVIL